MGLLDDAIREHLELKRLSGADPGVVAREEKDALGAVPRRGEEDREEGSEGQLLSDAHGSFQPDSESDAAADSSTVGQETVEINMHEELEAGIDTGGELHGPVPEHKAPMADSAQAQPGTEDSLEWEVPGDRSDESTDGQGSAGAGDPHEDQDNGPGVHVEDVLEETPDFLRDTPEQERLWFEQRPPRDFDFNE